MTPRGWSLIPRDFPFGKLGRILRRGVGTGQGEEGFGVLAERELWGFCNRQKPQQHGTVANQSAQRLLSGKLMASKGGWETGASFSSTVSSSHLGSTSHRGRRG